MKAKVTSETAPYYGQEGDIFFTNDRVPYSIGIQFGEKREFFKRSEIEIYGDNTTSSRTE